MQIMQHDCSSCALGVASRPGPCAFEHRHFAAGERLASQGTLVDRVWYLKSGLLLLDGVSEDGDTSSCALRGPGSLVGLESLNGEELPHDVWTVTDVEACLMDRPGFERWVGLDHTPAGAVLRMTLREVGARREERASVTAGAVERLARFLLMWNESPEADRLDSVPRHVLARVLSLRAETLSRALRKLRDGGALTPGHALEIADPALLRDAARAS
jgi:CRP-like cAMP-binding protein